MNGPFQPGVTSKPSIAPQSRRSATGVRDYIFDSVIVGGGPAGLAPLISASRSGSLDEILANRIAVVERGMAIGPGSIGGYAINSDSTAETLISCVYNSLHPSIAALRHHPAVEAVAAFGNGSVPLPLVGSLMAAVGASIERILERSPGCAVLLGHEAIRTEQTDDGQWRTELRSVSDGTSRSVLSRLVVLATGADQPMRRLETADVAGLRLLPRYEDKLFHSNEALKSVGLEMIGRRLSTTSRRRVAIVGGSSSAIACAHALLKACYGDTISVTVLHHHPLRVFYSSAATALAEGYGEFSPEDICPISGFVFRFAGFRLESRELVMAALGIGGRVPDRRLTLHRLTSGPDLVAQDILDDADVIVSAVGYRPRALPIFAASGSAIRLFSAGPGTPPLVDDNCCILDDAGKPIDGLFGIGLAAGFNARKAIGGEPSFSGQTNSLWQWQNGIGTIIAHHLLASYTRRNLEAVALHP